jgi:hypothetical protein
VKHSGISGVSLESVYCFVTGEQGLDGAHDSLFDAQAQYYVVKDNRFQAYTDKADLVMDIKDVCRDNGERVQAQKEEITRDVPTGWTEGLVDNPKIVDVIQPDQDTHKVLRMPLKSKKKKEVDSPRVISSYASTNNGAGTPLTGLLV